MAPDHLQTVLDKAAAQFYEENRIKVSFIYVPGEDIIGKLDSLSPFDAFITYNAGRFERIEKDLQIQDGYSCPFRLSLVLAGPADGPDLEKLDQLKKEYIRRVVIVDPEAGYEGQLAEEILIKTGLWEKIQPKLIMARSASHLLTYLATGEADAAIMLESSMADGSKAVIHQRLDKPLAKYLLHCGAVTPGSKNKESARAFLDLLDSRLCEMYKLKGVYQNTDE